VVNSVGDGGDFNPGDGVAATAQNEGTLRAAIEEANANPGPDVIRFDLPADSGPILPLTPLPAIRGQVFIAGYSQKGCAPNSSLSGFNAVLRVVLDGSKTSSNAGLRTGLDFVPGSEGSTVQGLEVLHFDDAIRLETGKLSVLGNFLHENDHNGVSIL